MLPLCGGKGASLARLTKAGLPVPEGYVLTAPAFEDDILPEAMEELETVISKLSDRHTYAVRSSALCEDGENVSFAGAYETVTDVSRRDIISAVKRVAASADSLRVKRYAESSGTESGGIAVVIPPLYQTGICGRGIQRRPHKRQCFGNDGQLRKGRGRSSRFGREKRRGIFL